jgi:hypothetical protein
MVYLQTPNVVVQWDAATRCVVIEWKDFAFGEEYRTALNTVLQALEENKSGKLLADSRRMKAIPQEDQEWLMKDWVPRSAKVGLKHSAVVLPKSTLGQMTLQRLGQAGGGKRLVSSDGASYFETIEEARKWLRSLPRGLPISSCFRRSAGDRARRHYLRLARDQKHPVLNRHCHIQKLKRPRERPLDGGSDITQANQLDRAGPGRGLVRRGPGGGSSGDHNGDEPGRGAVGA